MNDTSKLPRYMLIMAAILLVSAAGYNFSATMKPAYDPDKITGGSTANPAGRDNIAMLEDQTAKEPDNVEAWQLLGWTYFDNGRFDDAVAAYGNATKLAPDRAVFWSSLGEALVMADESNPMPENARAAFTKAFALNPKDPRARYFLAVDKDLAGDHEGAIAGWIALLADTEKNAPWERDLIRTIEQVGKINNIDVNTRLADVENIRKLGMATAAIPGPSRTDMANAARLPPEQQAEMIASMINGLETKLERNPGDIAGWVMLMRSRMTLGEKALARKAFQMAVSANPDHKEKITREARILDVPGV